MGTIDESVSAPNFRAAWADLIGRPAGFRLSSTLLTLLLGWMDRARQRRALRALDDRLLKDIGLTRADVEQEASKPFWRI